VRCVVSREVHGQVDGFAAPSQRPIYVEGAVEIGQRQAYIDVVQALLAPGLTVRINNGAVDDRDIAQANVAQEGRHTAATPAARGAASRFVRSRFGRVEFPVRFALGVDFELDRRSVQNEFVDDEFTTEQRKQAYLETQRAEVDHVGRGRTGRVGDGHPFECQLDRGYDRHANIAADRNVSTGRGFDLIFDLSAERILGH
jgi:hypothetical protein